MKKPPLPYLIFFALVMPTWLSYMWVTNGFSLYKDYWAAPFTMIFGSFIAGASAEGGGAVAFPVFTLLLDIPPSVARNFSFACQSIGMTAASMLIVGLKVPVAWRAVLPASIGGAIGLVLGTFYLVPVLPGPETKLFFVSLWLSFGFALYLSNRSRITTDTLALPDTSSQILMVIFGMIGGGITSLFGNGIDIFCFCLWTLRYGLSEKVATPTSVVVMTINTILGFFLHTFVIQDFQTEALNYWLCSIPVVLIFAPLGAYLITFLTRESIAISLYIIIIAQYIGAMFVLHPPLWEWAGSALVTLVGFIFFWAVFKQNKTWQNQQRF